MTGFPALSALVGTEVTGFLLVFARLGAALMLLPGFGELYVPSRIRLLLALAVTAALAPVLLPHLGPVPDATGPLLAMVAGETVSGLVLGAFFRILLVAVHLGGAVMATQSGLAAAAFFDPHDGAQGSIGAAFMTLAGLAVLFATDAHHALLLALADSYAALPAGAVGLALDRIDLLVVQLGTATAAGLRIAAPVVVLSLLLAALFGVLGRLVPALQALFLLAPVQLLLSLLVVMGGLAAGLATFLELVGGAVRRLAGG
ncbi:MAG: flagellar biosynthetic protein FliR [Geminicoccaceae bacterium]